MTATTRGAVRDVVGNRVRRRDLVLVALADGCCQGYGVARVLGHWSPAEPVPLYRLLRQLEAAGLVASQWNYPAAGKFTARLLVDPERPGRGGRRLRRADPPRHHLGPLQLQLPAAPGRAGQCHARPGRSTGGRIGQGAARAPRPLRALVADAEPQIAAQLLRRRQDLLAGAMPGRGDGLVDPSPLPGGARPGQVRCPTALLRCWLLLMVGEAPRHRFELPLRCSRTSPVLWSRPARPDLAASPSIAGSRGAVPHPCHTGRKTGRNRGQQRSVPIWPVTCGFMANPLWR